MTDALLVQCIACQRIGLKKARIDPEWARKGFGHCEMRIRGIRNDITAERDCEHFRPGKLENDAVLALTDKLKAA